MTILVTGTSGHLGHLIVERLLARGVPADQIVAGARTPAKVADLGVRAVELDYTKPDTITAALDGVDTVMLVSGSEVGQRAVQHANVIDAAKAAGVSRIVYTSAPDARESALILAPEHKATEEAIEASGIPATILRNGWYTENYAGTLEQAKSGEIVTSTGGGRVSSASRVDYADAAAVVLSTDGHEGAVYELSGDTAWDFDEFAAVASGILGIPVTHRSVSSEEHVAALLAAGLDEGAAGFVAALDGNIRDGLLGHTPGDLGRLIGRPTTPLAEGLAA